MASGMAPLILPFFIVLALAAGVNQVIIIILHFVRRDKGENRPNKLKPTRQKLIRMLLMILVGYVGGFIGFYLLAWLPISSASLMGFSIGLICYALIVIGAIGVVRILRFKNFCARLFIGGMGAILILFFGIYFGEYLSPKFESIFGDSMIWDIWG